MLSQLAQHKFVVGVKQSCKAIEKGSVSCLIVAKDAEMRVLRPILALSEQHGVTIHEVETMKQLGMAANINIGAAVVAVLL